MTTWRALTRYSLLLLSMGAVIAFYAWAVSPGEPLFAKSDGGGSYYNLLAKGFRSGHLSLPVEVPAGVLKLKDPYDPKQNAPFGMHDVSYYKGKFYLYFGAAPALVLYGPVAAISGRHVDDRQAVFLFCTAAFLAGSFLLTRVSRRYFPALGVAGEIGGIVAMGLATMVPVLLRRQEVYEVAVSSAAAFFMISLLCLFQALQRNRNLGWQALASLSYGLAIASRPTYLFGAACLLVPVFLAAREESLGPGREGPSRLACACAAIIPVGLVVAGLLVYNYLRFENPLEFGYHFAFSGSNERASAHFSPAFVWFNCRAYLFAPAHLSAYFPFVRVASLPLAPAGYMGVEDPYGILPNIPFVAFALAAPWACARHPRLGAFALGVAISSLAVAAVLFTFQFAASRYMVDFLPGLILLSVLGFWGLGERLTGVARGIAQVGGWVLLAWSVLFNVFAAFGHNEFLRISEPAVYRRLVHAFDYPRYLFDKAAGRTYGPLELTLRFPTGRQGKAEPLVITGSEFLSDYLYVDYAASDAIIIGFEHTGHGGPVTDALPVDYSRPHRVTVNMAPLYPPLGDPYFDGISQGKAEAFDERLTVSLDGTPVIDTTQQFYPPFALRPSVGSGKAGQAALGDRFTGEIIGIRSLAPDWNAAPRAAQVGPLVISLEFPVGQPGVSDPLVSSGYTGRGDLLIVNYLDSTHVTFSLDHWGYGGPVSAPVEIRPGTSQTLEVRFGSFFPASVRPADVPSSRWSDAASRLEVILDGKSVFDVKTPFYGVPAESVVVGRNPIGASSCAAKFTGRILSSRRGDLR
jgi:hypothetical protein